MPTGSRDQVSICGITHRRRIVPTRCPILWSLRDRSMSESARPARRKPSLFAFGLRCPPNKLYEDAVVAQAAALREPINLPGDLNWKAHATTDVFACRHGTSIHHCGA